MPIDRVGRMGALDGADMNKKVRPDKYGDDTGFSLPDEDREGVIYEPGSALKSETRTMAEVRAEIAREEAAAARANMHARFDGPGVEVELSTEGVSATNRPAEQTIGSILRDTWRSIVAFFSSIWNGGADSKVSEADAGAVDEAVGADAAGADTDAYLTDTAMTEASAISASDGFRIGITASRTNSPEDIAAFMTDYGGARLAKNSDLLTQYNRRGQIISIPPSDRRRILQGEGRVRRY